MDENTATKIIHVGAPLLCASLASIPVLYLQDYPILFFALIGVLWSAALIATAIRWIGLRSDPRHSKRPPDAP